MLSSVTCASRCTCVYAAETSAYVTQQELLDVQGLSRDFSHSPLPVDENISYLNLNQERGESPYSWRCCNSTTRALTLRCGPQTQRGGDLKVKTHLES